MTIRLFSFAARPKQGRFFSRFSLTLALVFASPFSFSATIKVSPAQDLQHIIDNSQANDEILLKAGEYQGNFSIKHPLTLKSIQPHKAVINSGGKGNGIYVKSEHVTVESLTVINWGDDLTEQDAGIYVDKNSHHLALINNQLQGDAFGIWVDKCDDVKVIDNTVVGNPKLRSSDRGNGIQLASVTNGIIRGNTASLVRDGLYVIASKNNTLEHNTMHDLRYGIHYMYSYDNKVQYNLSYNTRAGYALMSSRRLIVNHNVTRNSEDYGFLLNYITQSDISYNIVDHVWTKPENKVLGREGKGLFVYNSGYNTISHNIVDTAEIGIHLTAGSEKTKVFANSFINNPVQVKYVVNREEEWSKDGVGNYWSNYLGWDLNHDGRGDTPFEPNDGIDKMVWQYPEAKMLLDSPAVLILRWIQSQFPVLKPVGVKDSHPLMKPLAIDDEKDAGAMAMTENQ
ncbi:MAG: nitrous oxide reductase family maturation protein NosD [Parashewanella sp.]